MQHCLNIVLVNIIEGKKHACDHGLSRYNLITTMHEMYDNKFTRFDGSHVNFTNPHGILLGLNCSRCTWRIYKANNWGVTLKRGL